MSANTFSVRDLPEVKEAISLSVPNIRLIRSSNSLFTAAIPIFSLFPRKACGHVYFLQNLSLNITEIHIRQLRVKSFFPVLHARELKNGGKNASSQKRSSNRLESRIDYYLQETQIQELSRFGPMSVHATTLNKVWENSLEVPIRGNKKGGRFL